MATSFQLPLGRVATASLPFTLIFIIALFIFSCSSTPSPPCEIQSPTGKTIVHFATVSDSLHYLIAETFQNDSLVLRSQWNIPSVPYQMICGDIDKDGQADIMVGVVGTTRFDPKPDKRLFMFKLVEGYIRPLWLGSRVSRPLVDFCFEGGPNPVIRTVERSTDPNKYVVGEYRWRGFGLDWVRYLGEDLSLQAAMEQLR